MTHWQMYWFTRLDSMNNLIELVLVLGCIGLIAGAIIAWMGDKWPFPHLWRSLLVAWMSLGIIACLIPSQKDAAAIWLIPKLANNEQISNITSNSLDVLEQKTREYLRDLVSEPEE